MKENTSKIFDEYTWSLRAFLDINVHRKFYNNIKENEEITLVCKDKSKIEIITSQGFKHAIFSKRINEFEYFYYAIKAGAMFKGYIYDICENGSFNIHVFQYVHDDYKDPVKIEHNEVEISAIGRKYCRSSLKYTQEIEEDKDRYRLSWLIFIGFFALIYITAYSGVFYLRSFLLVCFVLLMIKLLNFGFKYKRDSMLKQQINEKIFIEEQKNKKDNEIHKQIVEKNANVKKEEYCKNKKIQQEGKRNNNSQTTKQKTLMKGDKVQHNKFGIGVIEDIDKKADIIKINFNGETRSFKFSYVVKNILKPL